MKEWGSGPSQKKIGVAWLSRKLHFDIYLTNLSSQAKVLEVWLSKVRTVFREGRYQSGIWSGESGGDDRRSVGLA